MLSRELREEKLNSFVFIPSLIWILRLLYYAVHRKVPVSLSHLSILLAPRGWLDCPLQKDAAAAAAAGEEYESKTTTRAAVAVKKDLRFIPGIDFKTACVRGYPPLLLLILLDAPELSLACSGSDVVTSV